MLVDATNMKCAFDVRVNKTYDEMIRLRKVRVKENRIEKKCSIYLKYSSRKCCCQIHSILFVAGGLRRVILPPIQEVMRSHLGLEVSATRSQNFRKKRLLRVYGLFH